MMSIRLPRQLQFLHSVVVAAAFFVRLTSAAEGDFMVRLWWEAGYLWQETREESWWCWTCHTDWCDVGDSIEIQECEEDEAAQRWKFVPLPGFPAKGQVRTAGRNLCVEAAGDMNRQFHLQECDSSNMKQLFRGFRRDSKFELTTIYDANDRCVTNHHHPFPGEEIRLQKCVQARKSDTSFLFVYKESTGNNTKGVLASYGSDGCDDEFPCEVCAGDCDEDSNCSGNLKCFQRDGLEKVPGCSGNGKGGIDYCYDPDSVVIEDNVDLEQNGNGVVPQLQERDGDPIFELGLCEGDCDSNDDCGQGLVCFQRDKKEAVPGCQGDGDDGWDYCVREQYASQISKL